MKNIHSYLIVVSYMSQAIMKDRWININYENDELRPYDEPSQDFDDQTRIGEQILHFILFSFIFKLFFEFFQILLYGKEVIIDHRLSIRYLHVNTMI